jgi:nicotinamidase-related amidase
MENTKIFFNIDTQQDFFDRDSLDIPNGESILNNLKSVSEYLKSEKIKTIHTIRWFTEDSNFFSEMPDYTTKLPKHCIKDSKGARFINQTAPIGYFLMDWVGGNLVFPEIHRNLNIVVTKKSPNIFEGNSFSEALINNLGIPIMQRPSFYLYGVSVGDTALSLLRRGYSVTIISDANINLDGQLFKKEDIIENAINPETGKQANETLPLNFITTKELIDGSK